MPSPSRRGQPRSDSVGENHRHRTAATSALVRKRSWVARHTVLPGALVGLGAGFAIGAATCRDPTVEGPSCDYTFPGNARLLSGLTIGGFGAGIGAGVGAVIRATR